MRVAVSLYEIIYAVTVYQFVEIHGVLLVDERGQLVGGYINLLGKVTNSIAMLPERIILVKMCFDGPLKSDALLR